MFCTKCGNEIINPNAKFCTKCGNPTIRKEEPKEEPVLENIVEEKPIVQEEKIVEERPAVQEEKSIEEKYIEEKPVVQEKKVHIEEEVIPEKEYSPLEQALNNMQNRQKKCPHCGMMVLNEARFCSNCGKQIK